MTSKERTRLRAQAMKIDSIFQIGKTGISPQQAEAVREALKARELVKINVLKNCYEDITTLARVLSERTGSEVVQVIGKKIILYKKNPKKEEKRVLARKKELNKREYARKKPDGRKISRKTAGKPVKGRRQV